MYGLLFSMKATEAFKTRRGTDMKKRKGIIALFTMLLLCVMSVPIFAKEISQKTMESMAETWAEALKTRNGQTRYDMMSDEMKLKFEQEQKSSTKDEAWNRSIGWSSPWVVDYEINIEQESAEIFYIMMDSTEQYYVMWDYIAFGWNENKNTIEVIAQNTTDLFVYDISSHTVVDSIFSRGYAGENIAEFFHIANAVKSMILTEQKEKFVKYIYFEMINTTKQHNLETINMALKAELVTLSQNPGKDSVLQNIKQQNIEKYIQLFESYNHIEEKEYTIQLKINTDTNGVMAISIQ